MIENIFYSTPSEPNHLPGCSRPKGSGSACDEQDPSFPCIGSAKDLIERCAKKTAHGTNQGSEDQRWGRGDGARAKAKRGGGSSGESRSLRTFLSN
jgi:hypothetical protein